MAAEMATGVAVQLETGLSDEIFLHHVLVARNSSTGQVTHTGIIEGMNPTVYNPKDPLTLFIIQASIIIIFCRLLEWPLSKIKQPRVISEVVGGIILGPSVMGRIPGFTDAIFPAASIPNLSLVANLGLLLFLFLIGVEVDLRFLASQWKPTLVVSIGSLVVPFGLGSALAWGIYNEFSDEPGLSPIEFPVFMLFVGLAISITAFPVLCRILTQLELLSSGVGTIVLAAGVANDVVGWILLALCIALVNAGSGITALWVLLATTGWTLFVFLAVKPVFIWILHRTGSFENGPSQGVITLTLLLTFASAFFTNVIGVHAIFGAFIVGLICPHESGFAIKLTEKIEDLVATIFLPLYFTLSGLSTNLALFDNAITWAYVVAVISVAFFSKVIGATAGARLAGMVWRESFTVGTLMSCKGLVELIVLNIGLQANILSTRTFTIFVVMALATTFATTPIVCWLYPPWYQQKLEKWKRGEIDWETGKPVGLAKSSDLALCSLDQLRFRRVFAYLRADSMVPLLSIVALFGTHKSDQPDVHHSLHNHQPPLGLSDKDDHEPDDHDELSHAPVIVYGSSLYELGQRGSSVMKVSELAEIENQDPLVNSFKVGAIMVSNVGVAGEVSIVSSSYQETLTSRADELNADLLLIPWPRSGSLFESNTFNLGRAGEGVNQQSFFNRMISSEHGSLVTDIYSRSTCPVAVFVHRKSADMVVLTQDGKPPERPIIRQSKSGISTTGSQRDFMSGVVYGKSESAHSHICVPYLGGRDDRAALKLGIQFAVQNTTVTLTVLHFSDHPIKSDCGHGSKDEMDDHGTKPSSPAEGITWAQLSDTDNEQTENADDDDEERYFAGLQSALTSQQRLRIVIEKVGLEPKSTNRSIRSQIVDRVNGDIQDVLLASSSSRRECTIITGRSLFRNAVLRSEPNPVICRSIVRSGDGLAISDSTTTATTVIPTTSQIGPTGTSGDDTNQAPSRTDSDVFEEAVSNTLGLIPSDVLANNIPANVISVQASKLSIHTSDPSPSAIEDRPDHTV